MIAGQVIIEDISIQFRYVYGQFQFEASDCLTGRQYGMVTSPDSFVKALALALHPDPDTAFPADFWNAAERTQEADTNAERAEDEPVNKGIRWIP